MDDTAVISWLHRRAGFGLTPAELEPATALGVDAVVERLVDPDAAGEPAVTDPWADLTFDGEALRRQAITPIAAWVAGMATGARPLEQRMTWFWHGHFATAIQKVKSPQYLITQLRLFARQGLGPFPDLLRAVTIDPAMLVWLDGRESTGDAPNENYGREVLELFTLGIGNYQEADVRAGARALTGWTVPKRADGAVGRGVRFVPARHDDAPQQYLGRGGVHDLDTVVDAICSDPGCATFVAGKLATAVLGPVDDGVVAPLADRFRTSGLDVRELLRAVLQAGVEQARAGTTVPIVVAPVPWLATVLHLTGASLPAPQVVSLLGAAGQVPMNPPSVGGWPSGSAWFATATVAARYQLAGLVAHATATDHPARAAAADGDHTALATALDRREGFSSTTRAALDQARRLDGPPGVAPLAIALTSPELVVA